MNALKGNLRVIQCVLNHDIFESSTIVSTDWFCN